MGRHSIGSLKSIGPHVDNYIFHKEKEKFHHEEACTERDRLIIHTGILKGDKGSVQVIEPAPKIVVPPADKVDFILKNVGDQTFNKLFELRPHPIKEFRAVGAAILAPKLWRRILEIVEIPSPAYLRML